MQKQLDAICQLSNCSFQYKWFWPQKVYWCQSISLIVLPRAPCAPLGPDVSLLVRNDTITDTLILDTFLHPDSAQQKRAVHSVIIHYQASTCQKESHTLAGQRLQQLISIFPTPSLLFSTIEFCCLLKNNHHFYNPILKAPICNNFSCRPLQFAQRLDHN